MIDTKKAVALNDLWHSRLPKITNPYSGHTICFGAEFKNRWYAVAIWTDPIARLFNGRHYLELRRMAISEDSPKNTASRMLRIMELLIKQEFRDIIKLISYQDTAIHHGTIYKASNWKAVGFRRGGINAWRNPGRYRKDTQAAGDKIRWEKDFK